MDHDNVEDCPVCLTTFEDTLRRPRTLPCGHTICTPCINELMGQGVVTCPTCRVSHALSEAGQFPISYSIEGLIRKMRSAGLVCVAPKPGKQQTDPAAGTEPAPRATAGLSGKTQTLQQEQEAKIMAAIRSCQEEQRQLAEYRATLGGWDRRQQQLEDDLQRLLDQNKGAREAISHEDSRVEDRQDEVRQREEALHPMLEALRTRSTSQEACEVIEDAAHLLEEEERAAVFPDVHVVTTVARVAEASRAALEAAAAATQTALEAGGTDAAASTAADAALKESSLLQPSAPASSIADRLAALLTPTLTAEELLKLTQCARGLVEAGRVFAVQDVKGQIRHARISLEHGRLHLHSLQATSPPPHALTLQLGEVVPAAPPCEVFLDLAWPGSAARRVVVSLSRDTPMGRQFVLLCSGQRGACYANTSVLGLWGEGEPGECVEFGDYETNDGKGGAGLLPHLDQGDYWGSSKAGAVCGWWPWCVPARGAQFTITSRDLPPMYNHICVFGEVVRGLAVVQEAAQHRPITEVTLVQCGVLLPQPH